MEELNTNTIGTIEAFTHSLRGVMVLFFFYWSYRLYPFHRQWMARLLFWATFYVACCYVKDGLLMVEGWKTDPFLVNLITVVFDSIFLCEKAIARSTRFIYNLSNNK